MTIASQLSHVNLNSELRSGVRHIKAKWVGKNNIKLGYEGCRYFSLGFRPI